MKPALLALAFVLFQTAAEPPAEVDAVPQRFATMRSITVPADATGQVCAVLDAPVYAHTEGRLTALRIYRNSPGTAATEIPFALTESGEANQAEEPARIQNLGSMGGVIVFDLAMPQRTYTSVVLSLAAQNFLGSAHVYGLAAQAGLAPRFMTGMPYPANARPTAPAGSVDLGTFALFDLTSQGLSRSTTLPLQEVTFPALHVELDLHPAPGVAAPTNGFSPDIVSGASVPPSRLAQTLYTAVAETTAITTRGRESIASVLAPAHVPIERATFTLARGFTKNFSREVRIAAYPGTKRAVAKGPRDDAPTGETLSGEIQRVAFPANGFYPAIKDEQLTIESVISSNLRSDATVEFAIQNQDDPSLPIMAIALQMRQRKLCFDAEGTNPSGTTYALLYGAPNTTPVRAPVYDYARLFRPSNTAAAASLGPETPNPVFTPLPAQTTQRSYTDRHPELLWIVLLAVVAVLGTIVIRSAKRAGQS